MSFIYSPNQLILLNKQNAPKKRKSGPFFREEKAQTGNIEALSEPVRTVQKMTCRLILT